jgi:PTS system glucitol/sorbitol-specific IIC component
MDFLASLAEGFIGLFNAGGETFLGLVTGIIPTLVVLITFVNSMIALIGEERVE